MCSIPVSKCGASKRIAWERGSVAVLQVSRNVPSDSSLKRWDSGTVALVEGLKSNGALATLV